MAENELKIRTFDDIRGLNGDISSQWDKIKCAVFTKNNFKSVFQRVKIEKDLIVYVLASTREVFCDTRTVKEGISSTIQLSRKFYIGQSSTGLQRIIQHCSSRDSAYWWDFGVAFYSDNFTIDIIRTIEKKLTELAQEVLPEEALASDPKNTFEGKQNFPAEAILPFIVRILNWMGIEIDLMKLSQAKETSQTSEKASSNSDVILFENAAHTARLSLNPSTGELKLLKGSHLASPDSPNASLKENVRNRLRQLPKDADGNLAIDYLAHSASGAAKLVTGSSVDGKRYWISTKDKKLLDEYLNS